MSATLTPSPFMQFFTAGGIPLVSGRLYTYAAGTTMPLATYTTASGTQSNTNPIILNSRGEAAVWLSTTAAYKFKLTDSTDVEIWTADNIEGLAGAADFAASTGSSLVGYIAAGSGAVATTVQTKLRQTVNVLDFGADPTGGLDATTAIQAALTAAAGNTLYVPDGTYTVTTMLSMVTAGSSLVLSNNATINYNTSNYAALKITASNCTVSGGLSGGFVGPAAWDGVNTSPTFGVIWITADKCSVLGTRLYNIRKVGVWAKDVEDCTVSGCLFEGNYPSASWTGTETGHWGVVFDPYVSDSKGNFKLNGNTIKTCVQGCQPGNYGLGGVVQGFIATGNVFESCWNHGIYSNFTNGATITGNNFNRCQIPVVISGNKNVVSGNTMFTSVTTVGDQRDVLGISVRDGSFNVINGNTLVGVLNYPTNAVGINIQDVSGTSDLIGNIVSNNTVDIPSGLGVAIRINASTMTCSDNVIIGNTVRASGITTDGLINVYGPNGGVGGAITNITKANPGVITTTSAHGLAVNDLVSILDVQGMTQINGTYQVSTVPLTTTFTVKVVSTGVPVDTSAYGVWTSGGVVRKQSVKNTGNKVTNNVLIAQAQTYGIYLINQTAATVSGNTVQWNYSAGSATNIPGVAVFDCYKTASVSNAFAITPSYGTNVSVQGFREYGSTTTVQVASNTCTNNINQIDTTQGAVFQSIESLSGSGLVVDVSQLSSPSLPCGIGSLWRQLDGTTNGTLWVKQSGTGATGWAPMGVAAIEDTAANIASKTATINTAEKYSGKLVWDTTNNRMLRANGATDVSVWYVVDGSVTVTPS